MIANTIAFFATIAILTVIAVATGRQPHPVFTCGVMVVVFGAANAINKELRHRSRGDTQSRPIVPVGLSNSSATATAANPEATRAKNEARSEPQFLRAWPRPGTNVVGQLVDAILMLTAEELHSVIAKPGDFGNVLAVTKPAQPPFRMFDERWFLVLSPASGVLFNGDASEVWSVAPGGVDFRPTRHITRVTVRSLDRRTESVPATAVQCAALGAWCSDSYDAYLRRSGPWPNGWGLVVYEIMTGHSPSTFLSWRPPFTTSAEAIDALGERPHDLSQIFHNLAGGELLKKLRALSVDESHPVFQAAVRAKRAYLWHGLIFVACIVGAGFVLALIVYKALGIW